MNKCAWLKYGGTPGTCRSAVEFSTTEQNPREYGNK